MSDKILNTFTLYVDGRVGFMIYVPIFPKLTPKEIEHARVLDEIGIGTEVGSQREPKSVVLRMLAMHPDDIDRVIESYSPWDAYAPYGGVTTEIITVSGDIHYTPTHFTDFNRSLSLSKIDGAKQEELMRRQLETSNHFEFMDGARYDGMSAQRKSQANDIHLNMGRMLIRGVLTELSDMHLNGKLDGFQTLFNPKSNNDEQV